MGKRGRGGGGGSPQYAIVPSATTSLERLDLVSTLTLDTGSFLPTDSPENLDLINEAIVTGVESRVIASHTRHGYVSSLVKGGGVGIYYKNWAKILSPSSHHINSKKTGTGRDEQKINK